MVPDCPRAFRRSWITLGSPISQSSAKLARNTERVNWGAHGSPEVKPARRAASGPSRGNRSDIPLAVAVIPRFITAKRFEHRVWRPSFAPQP